MIFPMILGISQPSSPVLGLEDPAAESLGRAALWCRADGRKRVLEDGDDNSKVSPKGSNMIDYVSIYN